MTSSFEITNIKKDIADNFACVTNPANNDIVGYVKNCCRNELDDAVQSARNAFKHWSKLPEQQRKSYCRQLSQILYDNLEELSVILTCEQGKPLNGFGSRWECQGAALWCDYTADLDMPVKVVDQPPLARAEIHRVAIGVVASITPWNYPIMIAIWHILPALRAGNTVIIKPSEHTPLATSRMVELFNTVLPAGVLNIVTGPAELGAAISEHPGIDKIVFTGSSPTGRNIMRSAAASLKRLTLELGGNDAAIVLADNAPSAIAERLFWGAFINSGQTCACIKRLYVHDIIYDDICNELINIAKTVKLGNGLENDTRLGPLQNAMQYKIVHDYVQDAKKAGARILTGGNPEAYDGLFYPVTLVCDIKAGIDLIDKEQFGPALPIIRFSNVDSAIHAANNNPNGLGGSVWSSDKEKAMEIAKKLDCGTVWINNHGMIQPNAPFGGVKQSGIGVEFGLEGLYQNTNIKTIITG